MQTIRRLDANLILAFSRTRSEFPPPSDNSSELISAMDGPVKPAKGGSALKRLKGDMKDAGVLGPKAKKRRTEDGADRARAIARTEKLAKLRGDNPFELKFARVKHDVLGRKTQTIAGRPGATRVKAEEKVRSQSYNGGYLWRWASNRLCMDYSARKRCSRSSKRASMIPSSSTADSVKTTPKCHWRRK